MKTILLEQTQPGQEFTITLSCYAPIETDATYYIADVREHVICSAPDKPILYQSRDNLARKLRHAGLVWHRE